MNDILKFGLLGGAAYLAYEFLIAPAMTTSVPAASSTVPGTSTVAPISVTTSAPITTPAVSAATLIAQQAKGYSTSPAGMGTVEEWNYFYTQVSGKNVLFVPSDLGLSGDPVISAASYLGYITSKGFSGLRGVGGLGMILDLVNTYQGVKAGIGFGAREFYAAGDMAAPSGLGVIEDDVLMSAGYIDEPPFVEAAAWSGSQSDLATQDFYAAASGQGS